MNRASCITWTRQINLVTAFSAKVAFFLSCLDNIFCKAGIFRKKREWQVYASFRYNTDSHFLVFSCHTDPSLLYEKRKTTSVTVLTMRLY